MKPKFLQIGECVAIWWRPNFETIMYPYCPPHITKPKVKSHVTPSGTSVIHFAWIILIADFFPDAGMQEALPCSLV